MKKIVILGAGLIGVATAYMLRQRGYEVVVIDRQSGPALETSFANGALLTPSMTDPWNSPGCWKVLLRSLFTANSPLKLHLSTLPSLVGWGRDFLLNSRLAQFHRSAELNLELALRSLHVMEQLRSQTGFEYSRSAQGTMRIFRDRAALDQALVSAERLQHCGLVYSELSPAGAAKLNPGLEPIASQLAGAIHYQGDEVGDAFQFSNSLARIAQDQGVHFVFDQAVREVVLKGGKVRSFRTNDNEFLADLFVVAAGSYTAPLMKTADVNIPVRPAKGYSLTISGLPEMLRIPLVDDDWHAAIVPLGNRLRIAGTAEFAGFDLTKNPERIRNLEQLLQRVLPQIDLPLSGVSAWCGLRPMSSDGVPIIGRSGVENLFVNTGHGHLGWTLAAGSAELLADIVSGPVESSLAQAYGPARFGSRMN